MNSFIHLSNNLGQAQVAQNVDYVGITQWKVWFALSTLICWIVIYLVDSIIQPWKYLEQPGPEQ